MRDSVEKSIEVKATPKRVWRALTDHREFGEWFGVKLRGPFEVGAVTVGHMTISGYEHLEFAVETKSIERERTFSFTWHPYAVDPDHDYSSEAKTLVEFSISPTEGGTRIVVVESGFSALPVSRYTDAIKMNDGGWEHQIENIRLHVEH